MRMISSWGNASRGKLGESEEQAVCEKCAEKIRRIRGRGPSAAPNRKLLCGFFFFHHNLQVRRDFLVQLDGNGELAKRLQRFVNLDLAAVQSESLLGQRIRDVA